MDDVYLGDGVSVSRTEYRILTGGRRSMPPRPEGEFEADLRCFREAGLDVVEFEEGAVVGGRFHVGRFTRTYHASTTFGSRTYGYRDPADLVIRLRGGEWEQTADARKRAEWRERRDDEEDDLRRQAYEKLVDQRLMKGCALPSGGAKTPRSDSGFLGVHWLESIGRWSATVERPAVPGMRHRERFRRAGFHETRIEAAIAFDRMNVLMRGRFARTNFPVGSTFLPTKDGGAAMAPDGSILVSPQPDDRRDRLDRSLLAPMEFFWESSFRDADASAMPKRHREAIASMYADPPVYADLDRWLYGREALDEIRMTSIDHLVEVLNDVRRRQLKPPISRREFPSDKARFAKLVREFRSCFKKVNPHPSRRIPIA